MDQAPTFSNGTAVPNAGNNTAISLGIAMSGGGYRAMLGGGGMLKALDSRTNGRKSSLNGLLDGATHMSALSGGGWLLSTLYHNDFKNLQALVDEGKVWNLQNGFFLPNGDDGSYFDDFAYFTEIAAQVAAKATAGFPISLTDIYGRLLSKVMFGQQNDQSAPSGAGTEWSDIQQYDYFVNRQAPYPIIMSVARKDGESSEESNNTSIEITPHEIGSFDASLHAFANLKYLGTNLDNNKVVHPNSNNNNNNNNNPKCISGLDNAGFISGTTSSVFDRMLQNTLQSDNLIAQVLGGLVDVLVDPTNLDVADYSPNPFYNYINPTYKTSTSELTKDRALHLVDGALAGENVPLWPLVYKPRKLDIIIASDFSSDSKLNWPTGLSLVNTLARASGKVVNSEEGSTSIPSDKNDTIKHFMPNVPDSNSFVNLGLTTQPAFFGCYATDYMSDQQVADQDLSTVPPIVIYLANTPMSYMSNTDTNKLQFNSDEMKGMIQNGFDIMDQNGDSEWPRCVACALLQRERERQGDYDPTDECQDCFDKYCWDGSFDSRDYNQVGKHNNPKVGHR